MTFCPNMTGPLRRVMVRSLREEDVPLWRDYGWRAEPGLAAAAAEHDAFRAILEEAGAEVIRATAPMPPNPDSIYMMDPSIVGPNGAVILRPGKEVRRMETAPMESDLAAADVVITGRLTGDATAEGGDAIWLNERTLCVGRSYRTNDEGIGQLRELLPGVEVFAFDLPHMSGPGGVLHLMSVCSPLDEDLAVVYLPLVPSRLVVLLRDLGASLVEVPDDEFPTMGPNVLALGPRKALALAGNDETRRRMEAAGVEVVTYGGDEISRKGDGGPTCLTRPLIRDKVR